MARVRAEDALVHRSPPWLQRRVGAKLLRAVGAQIDLVVDRARDGVALRFPLDAADPDALAMVGRERRIRRGPAEDATRYARRLRGWWDAHRTRGGPYALLKQLRAYLAGFLDIRVDIVAASGLRHVSAADGTITRDAITWGADGSGKWAQVWIFYYVPALVPIGSSSIVTDAGDPIITDGGDELITDASIPPDHLTDAELEVFRAIPREWSAAHISTTWIVLLWSTRRLWNYPQPVPTWTAWEASGALWGEGPVITTVGG